jgi:hypothetical protein
MAGQATPPRLVEPFANSATECTQASPVAGGKTFPLPVPSQTSTLNGAASLTDGFPALTMTNLTDGGIPPFGIDMNGILFVLSSWVAFLAAGQYPVYDATLQTAMGGYAQGARVQQAANSAAFWTSAVAANMTDPDTGGAGWISSVALYYTAAPGSTNDVVLPGPSDYVWDINTTSGAVTVSGFVAQRDQQKLFISNVGTGLLNFLALTGSAAANQLRIPTELTAVQDQTYVFQYSQGAQVWLLV